MVPASDGQGAASSSGSRRNPERAVSLPIGSRSAARPQRQGIPEEGLEIECATEKLKLKLEQLRGKLSVLLEQFPKDGLASIPVERIRDILSTAVLQPPCTVPCARCPQFRPVYPIQFEKIGTAQRLFAMCILIDDPFLICLLLSKGLEDAKFSTCKSADDLVGVAAIPSNTANELFGLKDSFFRVSIAKYIRSRREDNDYPQHPERNFVMDEVLDLMEKLEKRAQMGRDGTQMSITIAELTFGKSNPMLYERPVGQCPRFWDCDLSLRALGCLLLDVIWFLVGGSQTVLRLDKFRYRAMWTVEWVKLTPPEELRRLKSEPKLEKAFELARVMIQQKGQFGLSGEDVKDYQWAVVHFHKIWPQMDYDNIQDPGSCRGLDVMSISTRTFGADTSSSEFFEEIDATELRWLFLRCWKERGEEAPCRLKIFRARSGKRVRFDIYTIEKRPVEQKTYYDGLKFVPLYAYATEPGDLSAKLQPRTGSTRDIDIKHSFIFHNRADIRIFQEALTGRKIEADAKLDKVSLDVKREHEIRIGKMKVGSKWGEVEQIARDHGTIQLWNVLEKDELVYVHKQGLHQPHGIKDYPLRLEIAIFAQDMFIVIGVKSPLRIREWGKVGYGLSIMSKDPTSSSMLIGREYVAETQDDEKIYPGLPLFQNRPFELPQDGKKVWCQSLILRFATAEDREEIRDILIGVYNASLVDG